MRKHNIKVAVRIRPPNHAHSTIAVIPHLTSKPPQIQVLKKGDHKGISTSSKANVVSQNLFAFDHVFSDTATQVRTLFRDLVQSYSCR